MPCSKTIRRKPHRILFLCVVAAVVTCVSEYFQCFVMLNPMCVSRTLAFRLHRLPDNRRLLRREDLLHPSYVRKLISTPTTSRASDGFTEQYSQHVEPVQRIENSIRTFPSSNDVKRQRSSHAAFIQQVVSFLERDFIPYRLLNENELNKVLHSYARRFNASDSFIKIKEWESMFNDRTILLVGNGCQHQLQSGSSLFRNAFVLHLCPTLHLADIEHMHQQCHQQKYEQGSLSQTSAAVAAYAWLNACLTNAFLHYNPNAFEPSYQDQKFQPNAIVHLHQDVWNRSPNIVQSRLRCKSGVYDANGRIFARKTIARRISKSEYLPFLEQNHLWGATSAKYAYGLYLKVSKNPDEVVDGTVTPYNMKNGGTLVAVATFSSKRKVHRAGQIYHSYELLRFCTKLNTTIVGGLTKLVASFVKDIPHEKKSPDHDRASTGIDIITSIDRDFGSNRWPGFETMDVMDPVPMFIGERDGIRRHAVGAGLMPLEQSAENVLSSKALRTSELLRAGLPSKLLRVMDNYEFNEPWGICAQTGFHPVFDAGVERLMCVIENPTNNASNELSQLEMWEQSFPKFVKEHYSPNKGVEQMLHCIRTNRMMM
ncbi:hypothetical protein ACHAW6_014043 [Cyclotella cf. meneghiniana]